MRWVVGDRAAASASQIGRFDTKWLIRKENLAALADLPGQWVDKVHTRRPPRIVVLDRQKFFRNKGFLLFNVAKFHSNAPGETTPCAADRPCRAHRCDRS